MTLGQAQRAFAVCVAEAILYMVYLGYEVALDEGTERLTAKDPTSDHMKGSVHHIRLAQDLLLYKNGVYLTKTPDYLPLGVFWEKLGITKSLPLRWGGRFEDGNHISFEWQGVK